MDTLDFDVVIIGAGMAGATAAAHCAWRGLKVALLEAEETAGYHSTGRSAALWILNYGPPDVRRLSGASRAFFEAHARRRGLPLDVLRANLERAQAGYFLAIFEEAAGAGEFRHERCARHNRWFFHRKRDQHIAFVHHEIESDAEGQRMQADHVFDHVIG